jgi:hypothetical protein
VLLSLDDLRTEQVNPLFGLLLVRGEQRELLAVLAALAKAEIDPIRVTFS